MFLDPRKKLFHANVVGDTQGYQMFTTSINPVHLTDIFAHELAKIWITLSFNLSKLISSQIK